MTVHTFENHVFKYLMSEITMYLFVYYKFTHSI